MNVDRRVGIAIGLAGAVALGASLARAVAHGDWWIAIAVLSLASFALAILTQVADGHAAARLARYRSALDSLRGGAGAYRSTARPRADLEPPTQLERDVQAWEIVLTRAHAAWLRFIRWEQLRFLWIPGVAFAWILGLALLS